MDNTSNPDAYALAVGRAIMTFADLDQSIYFLIARLQFEAEKLARREGVKRDDEKVDDRFTHRVRHARRLLCAFVGENHLLIRRWDCLKIGLSKVERMRAHLAHATLTLQEDGLAVWDRREWEEYGRVMKRDANADLNAARAHHIDIVYSLQDINNLQDRMHGCHREMNAIFQEARELLRKGRPQTS